MLTIGYIGLGIMGKSIARNILKAGFPVVVHNRSRAAVQELKAEGAKEAFSPREVAAMTDVIFTNLPDSPDVETVVLGKDGIIEAARSRTGVCGQFHHTAFGGANNCGKTVAERSSGARRSRQRR